jgi:hypothetical protein
MDNHMASNKSLDVYVRIIAAHLRDAHASFGGEFNTRSLRLTTEKVEKRIRTEGVGLLTKTFPRLCKHFDKVLAGQESFDSSKYRFESMPGSKLPKLLGELFERVLSHDGTVLPSPDAKCVGFIREFLGLFYKLKLPYEEDQESQVIQAFEKAEEDLANLDDHFDIIRRDLHVRLLNHRRRALLSRSCRDYFSTSSKIGTLEHAVESVREARILLSKVFQGFNGYDIIPRHGPGAVATKQEHADKFRWTNVSSRITEVYPIDAYFYASAGHFCDSYNKLIELGSSDLPARVILVPKDSRGPRLISAEPVDFQWIQQGLMAEIVRRVESHYLTKGRVNFTDQQTNRDLSLLGSIDGSYATLDLKEASDRVHVELVRLLFPDHVLRFLECSRSSSTRLPDGRVLQLRKFAPMGSALCFPIMALTIWSLLYAIAPRDVRKDIYVYGDDVIVPQHFAESAMAQLEYFGLRINRDKSCTKGLFRESCGMDAFIGVDVTPVRIRTVWSESPSPGSYLSYISYANAFFDKRRYNVYYAIISDLERLYGTLPGPEVGISAPSIRCNHHVNKRVRRRWNKNLQRFEYLCLVPATVRHVDRRDGWISLLRYFTEFSRPSPDLSNNTSILKRDYSLQFQCNRAGSIDTGTYTKRRTVKLVLRWR